MLTLSEAAQRLGLTKRFVRALAGSGRLAGAEYYEDRWLIPEEAVEAYREASLGQRGRKKGVKTSSVRRVVELRLRRLGAVKTRELAADLGVTQSLITAYLRELGAVFNPRTRTWKPAKDVK
jgi:excisionase family DNA binding protein